jgi:hypothetical protein
MLVYIIIIFYNKTESSSRYFDRLALAVKQQVADMIYTYNVDTKLKYI